MKNRDVESVRSRAKFATLLRRVAAAVEAGEPVRVQVAGQRVLVPAEARLSVEHEVEGTQTELELQLTWQTAQAPAPNGIAKGATAKTNTKTTKTTKTTKKKAKKRRA